MATATQSPKSSTDWRQLSVPAKLQLLERLKSRGLFAQSGQAEDRFKKYRLDPHGYISDVLGCILSPQQSEIVDSYLLALRQQIERDEYENGKDEDELEYYRPADVIQNRLRIEAGHNVGKTYLAAMLISHFFDSFVPSIIYTYAPTWEQIHDLLWKEIAVVRDGKNLTGRLLDTCELKTDRKDHFAKGRATSDAGGKGAERVQGQHGKYLMFVLDEAEGVADYVFDAIDSMTSGGVSIVLMPANPRTRTSKFHKAKAHANVKSFRLSCLDHPNVLNDREVIPGAVRRQYVLDMIDKHCRVVDAHDADAHTFTLPWEPNVIYLPDSEFLFRVLGIAPANLADKCLIPVGRYEAACKRERKSDNPSFASMGVDCARWGLDVGTLYIRHDGAVWRAAVFAQTDQITYYLKIKSEALRLSALGVTHLEVRIDAGGGFGGGVCDLLKADDELSKSFASILIIEAAFGSSPQDKDAFYDAITEWTADVAESLKALAIINPPSALEGDLCEREVEPRNVSGKFVRKLEEKDKFRKRMKRSPDDGDGFILAVASPFLFVSVAPPEIIDNPFY